MSKIGKRAILLLLALPIGFNVMAQETKKPTLEELIPGGESYLYAENLYGLQWWGDECIKPGIDTLYSVQPQTGKEEVLFTREQVNKALASAGYPKVLTNSATLPCWHVVRNTGTDAPRTTRVS